MSKNKKKKEKKIIDNEVRICMVGGQALMEGIMMRGEYGFAQVIRNAEGELVTEYEKIPPVQEKHKILAFPFIRGTYRLIDSLKIGMKSLFRSAEIAGLEDDSESKSKFDIWLEKKLGDKAPEFFMTFALIISLALTIFLFFLLPNLIAGLLINKEKSQILYNLIEGIVRMMIFLGYLLSVSKMKEIRRVFMYHGAEHKTIHCYEHDEPLTVENIRKYSTLHPRCGTAFLFIVMIISILIYSLVPRHDFFLVNVLVRIVMLPVVTGIAYEFNRFAGRNNKLITRILRAPGMAMQYFTTKEPDEDMIEIAIVALNKALEIDAEARKEIKGESKPFSEELLEAEAKEAI